MALFWAKPKLPLRRLGQAGRERQNAPKAHEEALARLSATSQTGYVQADFIIEAVVEKLAVKHELFQQLAAQ